MGCRSAKDTPPPRHVKDVSNQSLIDSGISRPTTLASLAIRSDCVSSDCGKNLSFSSFCCAATRNKTTSHAPPLAVKSRGTGRQPRHESGAAPMGGKEARSSGRSRSIVGMLSAIFRGGALPADKTKPRVRPDRAFSRGTIGSAGTRQPAATARRSQARGRARPAHDAGEPGCTCYFSWEAKRNTLCLGRSISSRSTHSCTPSRCLPAVQVSMCLGARGAVVRLCRSRVLHRAGVRSATLRTGHRRTGTNASGLS